MFAVNKQDHVYTVMGNDTVSTSSELQSRCPCLRHKTDRRQHVRVFRSTRGFIALQLVAVWRARGGIAETSWSDTRLERRDGHCALRVWRFFSFSGQDVHKKRAVNECIEEYYRHIMTQGRRVNMAKYVVITHNTVVWSKLFETRRLSIRRWCRWTQHPTSRSNFSAWLKCFSLLDQ